MPIYYLKIKADLENIEKLTPIVQNLWKLDIESPDGADIKKGITVSSADVEALDGSRGEANFVVKFPGSSSQAYIKLVSVKNVSGEYKSSGQWVTILGMECRGLVPSTWIPGIDFNATSSGGTQFEGIDLADKEWADYDEENDLTVSVLNLETKIETSL